jgi:hypothetical protein
VSPRRLEAMVWLSLALATFALVLALLHLFLHVGA